MKKTLLIIVLLTLSIVIGAVAEAQEPAPPRATPPFGPFSPVAGMHYLFLPRVSK